MSDSPFETGFENLGRAYLELEQKNTRLQSENQKLRKIINEDKQESDRTAVLEGQLSSIQSENARLREQLDKYRGGIDANIQNRKELGLLTEEEHHLIGENERLREQLNASQSAYEKMSKLFNELEKSQNEACKQLKTAMEAFDAIKLTNHKEGEDVIVSECPACIAEQALAKIGEMKGGAE